MGDSTSNVSGVTWGEDDEDEYVKVKRVIDTSERDKRANAKTPVIPFRVDSPEEKQRIIDAARAQGLTVSEWMRRVVLNRLDTADSMRRIMEARLPE